eukprot:TRINITY_DN5201_c0_g1_i14.p1 TRINITY_DN5201_c0_g1~~TRINITY_DN5201_c0_g1_i14.p1  ORF type:complete len:244 (+),score=86.15 TRINITY_DN5201_c0_g1_i14:75-806(+)
MARGVTSEWDDIQRKLGNYAPIAQETPEHVYNAQAIEKMEQYDPLEKKTAEQLKELEDDLEEDVLNQYMKKRMEEIKEQSSKPRFGKVLEISKQDYVTEVNEAPKGVPVVIHLYQDYVTECRVINERLNDLAAKYQHVKFIRSVATRCVENFPDSKCPTMIFYQDGKILSQVTNADKQIGKLTVENVERLLARQGVIPSLEEDEEDAEVRQLQEKFMTRKVKKERSGEAVSYTHLTLPTIYSV